MGERFTNCCNIAITLIDLVLGQSLLGAQSRAMGNFLKTWTLGNPAKGHPNL
jgi:hypothetical protein